MVDRQDEWDGPPTAEAKQGGGTFVLRVVGEGFVSSHALPSSGTVRIGRAEGLEVRLEDPSTERRRRAGGADAGAVRRAERALGVERSELDVGDAALEVAVGAVGRIEFLLGPGDGGLEFRDG